MEIKKEYETMEFVESKLKAGKEIRNSLAHGSTMLSPSSPNTLKNISVTINILFEDK